MKWLDRWFYNKVRWCWQRADIQHPDWKIENDVLDEVSEKMSGLLNKQQHNGNFTSNIYPSIGGIIATEHDAHGLTDGLTIDVKKLSGGWVVTFRIKNTPDKHGNYVEPTKSSHIINDEQDFSTELCKLITFEQLRN